MKRPSAETVARSCLGLMWLWLAATSFSGVGASILSGHLSAHALLGGVAEGLPPGILGGAVGGLQLVAAALLVLPAGYGGLRYWGAVLSASLATVSLTLLFTNPVWMESLGGFPAIGSGQGLLKYASVAGLSVHLMGLDAQDPALADKGKTLAVGGLALPLVWIGAMKFTLPEAEGIQGLLSTSPFFSWMGEVFSVQGASNVIGVSEFVTVAFLLAFWKRPFWAVAGGLLGAGTFLATLSFMVTAPGWNAELGFPMLSRTGVFLVKDLALLAVSVSVVAWGWDERAERYLRRFRGPDDEDGPR